jgi:glycosyltransferase involved in cell wall biosynthesis
MKATLLVPTWNEIDGMRKIMPLVKPEWYDQILVLDGGSVDGTIEYAKEHGYEVYVQKKPGFRNGYTEIWPMVKGDIVVTFSPDGNSLPEAIPQLIAKMREGYDMVIASRYLGSAKSEDDDFMTGFGNWLFTKIINVLHGGHYTDSMVILRAYRTSLVTELELDKDEGFVLAERLFSTNISWEPLLSVRAAKRKLKVTEIPADEPPRIGGVRKLQVFRWGAAFLVQFVREVFVWK